MTQRLWFYPNQGWSSLCSAAAVFYCLQQDRPDLYRQIVLELGNRGETCLGNKVIKPREGCCHPKEYFVSNNADVLKVSPIDWITLASLRDSTGIFPYDSPDDQFSGITDASTVIKWFGYFGAARLNKPWKSPASSRDNNYGFIDNHDKLYKIVELNNYLSNGKYAGVLINASLLGSDSQSLVANHWIVIVKPISLANGDKINESSDLILISSKEIKFECFSWGSVQDIPYFRNDYNINARKNNKKTINISPTLEQFMARFYDSLVFESIL